MKTNKNNCQEMLDMQWHIIHRVLAIYNLFDKRPAFGIGRKVYDILYPSVETLKAIHYYELGKLKDRIAELEAELETYKSKDNEKH